MKLKLCCNEDGQPIEDIFFNNYGCKYRAMCAGCELLVKEEDCDYIKYICGYDPNEYDDHTIEGDQYPWDGVNTPCDSIMIETLSTMRAHECDYTGQDKKCQYKGECPFQEEE